MHEPAAASPFPDYRALFEAAPDLYLVLDPALAVVAASTAYLQATGTRREDLLGKSVFALVLDQDAHDLRASLQRVVDTDEADAMPACPRGIRPPDGAAGRGERYWRALNSPVRGSDGKLAYILHKLEDVTELVRLRQREAEAGARLQCAIDEAQRFAYLAAHDLQSPLNAISGCVRLLHEECEGKLSEQGDRFMGYVLDYTQRAQTLIRDLLAYSRLESQAQPFEPTCLGKACQEALDAVAMRIAEAEAKVACGDLPTLSVDRHQMVLLLAQLIDNAVKFNRAERPEVRIASELRGDEWLFSVCDNGIGIEARFHEEIFEIFRRLHSAQAYAGSGIGLAMCRRIVTRHGGRIWVESKEGEGSTFLFTLPVAGMESA